MLILGFGVALCENMYSKLLKRVTGQLTTLTFIFSLADMLNRLGTNEAKAAEPIRASGLLQK